MAVQYVFELASSEDDAQLRSILAETHMGEGLRVSFRREPSYFSACRTQGDNVQIIKCTNTQTGKIVGLASRFLLSANVNGKAQRVGYLGDLRIGEGARKGTILARGYKFLYELHQQQPVDFYYTLVLSNNTFALKQLTSRRATLPEYKHLGKILSPVIFLDLPKPKIILDGVSFSQADAASIGKVFAFLREQNSRKQFSPVYDVSHYQSERLLGLQAEDIYVAYRGGKIVATIAAWDQRAFRQTHVEGYSTGLGCLRPFYNALAKISPLKPLPALGGKIPYLYLSMLAAENDDVVVFAALLRHVYREKRAGPWCYAIAGLHENDPLAKCLLAYRHIATSGELFIVNYLQESAQNNFSQPEVEKGCSLSELNYSGISETVSTLDQRVPYIEIACV